MYLTCISSVVASEAHPVRGRESRVLAEKWMVWMRGRVGPSAPGRRSLARRGGRRGFSMTITINDREYYYCYYPLSNKQSVKVRDEI